MGSKRQTILGRSQSGGMWGGLKHDCNSTTIAWIAMNCVSIDRVLGDRVLTPDRLQLDPNSGAVGDVFLQFVDFPGFWCNPFDPLAIRRNLVAIQLDCEDCDQDCCPDVLFAILKHLH